jgi:hypothetical protein
MPAFDTPGPIAATVVVAGAQVRVTASDRADTVVLVEPIDKASKKDIKVASKTKVDFAAGQLSVKTTVSGGKNGSVAITIGLPAGSGLVAYLAHSRVHADGSLGDCELHMASGRAQLDRISALQARETSRSASARAPLPTSTPTASEGRCAIPFRRRKTLPPPATGSRSMPARGTATSSFSAQRADPHEASVTSIS